MTDATSAGMTMMVMAVILWVVMESWLTAVSFCFMRLLNCCLAADRGDAIARLTQGTEEAEG